MRKIARIISINAKGWDLKKEANSFEASCVAWMNGSQRLAKSSHCCRGFSRQREGVSVRFEDALGRFFSFSKSSMASSIGA